MPKKPSRKNLVKKLDTVFSEYIRRKYADENGIVKCYTCDKKAFWKGEGMQNGNFISRKSRILRWREDNCRPQCYTCNCHFYGRQYIFSVNLNKEYGYDISNDLLIESKKIIKQSDLDLKEMIEYYNKLLTNLK